MEMQKVKRLPLANCGRGGGGGQGMQDAGWWVWVLEGAEVHSHLLKVKSPRLSQVIISRKTLP